MKRESDRERVRKEDMEAARKEIEEQEAARKKQDQYHGMYGEAAGPPKPPIIGPMLHPKEEKRRARAEAIRKDKVT